jgi:hypothetical protein
MVTVAVKNIPLHYVQDIFIDPVKKHGFEGRFDLLYIVHAVELSEWHQQGLGLRELHQSTRRSTISEGHGGEVLKYFDDDIICCPRSRSI